MTVTVSQAPLADASPAVAHNKVRARKLSVYNGDALPDGANPVLESSKWVVEVRFRDRFQFPVLTGQRVLGNWPRRAQRGRDQVRSKIRERTIAVPPFAHPRAH